MHVDGALMISSLSSSTIPCAVRVGLCKRNHLPLLHVLRHYSAIPINEPCGLCLFTIPYDTVPLPRAWVLHSWYAALEVCSSVLYFLAVHFLSGCPLSPLQKACSYLVLYIGALRCGSSSGLIHMSCSTGKIRCGSRRRS